MNKIDVATIRQMVELRSLAEQSGTKWRNASRRWHTGSGPFCGGKDRFTIKHTPDGDKWYCRNCGDGKYHDAIDFIKKHHNCNFLTAAAILSTTPTGNRADKPITQPQKRIEPPNAVWQRTAQDIVEDCSKRLWSDAGIQARDLLHARGLKDETLRKWEIGYSRNNMDSGGTKFGTYVPDGTVIPCLTGNTIWYLKVRRAAGSPKYAQVKGSRPAVYGADRLRGHDVAIVCEGEFDAMLLHQEVGDLCGVITLGSASATLDVASWAGYLLPVKRFLVAYDTDSAGIKGAAKLGALTSRAKPLSVPKLREGDKDITDFVISGGDLRQWLQAQLVTI